MTLSYKWEIGLDKKVLKSIDKIPERDKVKIFTAINSLREDPVHGVNIKRLQGDIGEYRLRVGDYRVIYDLDFSIIKILVIKIAHRKEVYKN